VCCSPCCSVLQSVLQCVAVRVAVCCSPCCSVFCGVLHWEWINTLQHTATHCNTLQHTATHCNTHSTEREGLFVSLGVWQCVLRVCMCVSEWMCQCQGIIEISEALMHTYTHAHTHTHTYTHTPTHTHTRTSLMVYEYMCGNVTHDTYTEYIRVYTRIRAGMSRITYPLYVWHSWYTSIPVGTSHMTRILSIFK